MASDNDFFLLVGFPTVLFDEATRVRFPETTSEKSMGGDGEERLRLLPVVFSVLTGLSTGMDDTVSLGSSTGTCFFFAFPERRDQRLA